MEVRHFEPQDRAAVIEVWARAGIIRHWNDPVRDIERKIATDPEGFLVAVEGCRVVGAVMAGYDGHRGWIQYMAVDPAEQRKGIGRALLTASVNLLRRRGCPKVNLQVRRSNAEVISFYEKSGFQEDDVLSMGLRLIDDVAGPTPNEPDQSS